MSQTAAPDPLAPVRVQLAQGDLAGAERTCRAAIAANADDARAHGLLAHVLHRAQRADEALAAATRSVELDPAFAPALIEQAAAARTLKRWPVARAALEALVARAPTHAALHYDLGTTLMELGEIERARTLFERALELEPRLVDADFKLGLLALHAFRNDEATQRFARCLAARPDWPEAWLDYAECLLRAGKLQEAADAATRGIDQRGDDPASLRLFARTLRAARRDYSMYLEAKRRLCQIEPTPKNRIDLALTLWEGFYHRGADAVLEKTLAEWPDYWPGRWAHFQYPQQAFIVDDDTAARYLDRWRSGLADLESRDVSDPARREEIFDCARLCTNFYTHYVGLPLVEEQRRHGALLERMLAASAPPHPEPKRIAAPGMRRRVGFVSGYLRHHTIMKLFGPMISRLDRALFEVHAYMVEDDVDAMTEALREKVDVLVHDQADAASWVRRMGDADLDVLVFLDVGMNPVAQVLSSLRFAPVQCVLWGHPVTTGRSTVDYFLSSELMEPANGDQHYTEQLVRLPNLGTYYEPPTAEPEPAPDWTPNPLPDPVDFFFAQTVYKNTPVHDDVFARICEALPGARIHLVPHEVRHVREALLARMRPSFERRGLDIDRHIVMHPPMKLAHFFGLAKACDVNLDSIGWSGGNTTLEILWQDVPTITVPGSLMRARHTAAILGRVGLDELVAPDVDAFVDLAITLGRDRERRERLSALIRERKHVLYRDDAVVEGLNRFLATAMPRTTAS